jgi:hypothetical protein
MGVKTAGLGRKLKYCDRNLDVKHASLLLRISAWVNVLIYLAILLYL